MSETNCCQPVSKTPLADSIIEITAQHFEIESAEDKCDLKLLFDLYADIRMRERITTAFSNLDCGKV